MDIIYLYLAVEVGTVSLEIFHLLYIKSYVTSYVTSGTLIVDCFIKILILFSIEEDFMTWKEEFWPTVCNHFGIDATGEDIRY